jgi:hypothetical protein
VTGHVLSVHGDYGHLKAWDADVEVRHRRPIDEAQPDALARPEHSRPVDSRRGAVHQIRVGVAGDVGEIGRVHAHLAPRFPIGHCAAKPELADVTKEVTNRTAVKVVVVRLLLQFCEDALRLLVRPVSEHHHVLAVVAEGLRILWLDYQRAVHTELLLKGRVAVVPVRATLSDWKRYT